MVAGWSVVFQAVSATCRNYIQILPGLPESAADMGRHDGAGIALRPGQDYFQVIESMIVEKSPGSGASKETILPVSGCGKDSFQA